MTYFYDQYSHASRLSGIRRSKRDLTEFNQALYQAHLAESRDSVNTHSSNKSSFTKPPESINRQLVLSKSQVPFIPDNLVKELDATLKPSDENPEDQPKVSLPSELILQFHSSWTDLIKNTEYKSKAWQTKAGEDAWRQYTQRKRVEQVRLEKRQIIHETKSSRHQRSNSHASNASGKQLLRRPSIANHPSRPTSRASFISTTDEIEDNQQTTKAAPQGGLETTVESTRNGIHVEFKFSSQILRAAQRSSVLEQKLVQFDVQQQPGIDLNQEVILAMQSKCKRLLAETKQKILTTTDDLYAKEPKMCRVWFYDDNQFLRNKTSLLSLNESNRGQKSKFVLSILRRSIPEKYNIDVEIPPIKKKCYIELLDGSSQIYYPSGRLAVLRLRSPIGTTLFFDDTSIAAKQFLGLVTSSGNVLIMQPMFHARFLTNHRNEYAYLCDGKTGLIENQLTSPSKRKSRRHSTIIDDEEHLPSLDNTVQFQLNSCMQLEYNSPSNILFAFTCQDEEFKYQLGGMTAKTPTPTLLDITTTAVLITKRMLEDKKTPKKRISSINNNDVANLPERQRVQSSKSTDEPMDLYQLPIMKELFVARKRIQNICDAWLKEYRTVLGIMDIDAYCLSDLPSSLAQSINNRDIIQPSEHVPFLSKRTALNTDFTPAISNRSLLIRSARTSDRKNLITESIEQFIPHSDLGRVMKQQICSGKRLFSTTLPILK